MDLSDSDDDIAQLEAVALDCDKETFTSSNCKIDCVTGINTDVESKLSDIESSLTLNKIMREKFKQLEATLQQRLVELREKLKALDEPSDLNLNKPDKKYEVFRYVLCGKPYFKDRDFYPPPPNQDTITMNELHMFDYVNIQSVRGWSVGDKKNFSAVLYQLSLEKRRQQLKSQLARYNRMLKTADDKSLVLKIDTLNEKIATLSQLDLKDLALPIEDEYDWEVIANKLHYRHTAEEYQSLWKLYLHPSLNKEDWSACEHQSLVKIATLNNRADWDRIAKELNTNRSGYQCFVYYRTNVATSSTGLKWSKEEEEYLKRIVESCRVDDYIPWSKVASYIGTRTKLQIYNRWMNSSQPELKKGRFLREEDAVLRACIEKFGKDYHKASTFLPGRTPSQLRVHYLGSLAKTTSVEWTVEEDRKLLQLVAQMSDDMNYSDVAKSLPGKDRVNVRLRYLTLHKWMKMYPMKDVSDAPRRKARCVSSLNSERVDLETAIDNLTEVLQSEIQVQPKKSKRQMADMIEKSLVIFFINEFNSNQNPKQNSQEKEVNINEHVVPYGKLKITNLRKELILLRANLDKSHFVKNNTCLDFNELLNDKDSVSVATPVKTYSRKKVSDECLSSSKPKVSIWSATREGEVRYIMPPNFSSIIGCKTLLLTKPSESIERIQFTRAVLKNKLIKTQWDLLQQRFEIVFSWPLQLSNISPNLSDDSDESNLSNISCSEIDPLEIDTNETYDTYEIANGTLSQINLPRTPEFQRLSTMVTVNNILRDSEPSVSPTFKVPRKRAPMAQTRYTSDQKKCKKV